VATLGLSTAALAGPPVVPTPQPVAGPTPSPTSGNGGLIVSAWSASRGLSVVEYLGLTMDDFLPMTTDGAPEAGLSLAWDISSWNVFNGVTSDVVWHVTAGDSTVDDVSNTFIGKRLLTTFVSDTTSVRNGDMSGALNSDVSFIDGGLNAASGCGGGNPCTAITSGEGDFAGRSAFGSRLNGSLPINASVAVG